MRWLLAARPKESVTSPQFRKDITPIGQRRSRDAVLVRHELIACALTIRNLISGRTGSFHPSVAIGTGADGKPHCSVG
jgi:hypothetical protein